MFFRIIVVALSLLFTSACVTTYLPKDYAGPTATLVDTGSQAPTTRRFHIPKYSLFYAAKINDKFVHNIYIATDSGSYGGGFATRLGEVDRLVPIEPLTIDLIGESYTSAPIAAWFHDMHRVSGKVQFTPEPGQTYYVRGTLSKSYSAVWIENAAGVVVSDKVEKIATTASPVL